MENRAKTELNKLVNEVRHYQKNFEKCKREASEKTDSLELSWIEDEMKKAMKSLYIKSCTQEANNEERMYFDFGIVDAFEKDHSYMENCIHTMVSRNMDEYSNLSAIEGIASGKIKADKVKVITVIIESMDNGKKKEYSVEMLEKIAAEFCDHISVQL